MSTRIFIDKKLIGGSLMNKYKILEFVLKYRLLIVLAIVVATALFGVTTVIADGTGGYPGPISGGG